MKLNLLSEGNTSRDFLVNKIIFKHRSEIHYEISHPANKSGAMFYWDLLLPDSNAEKPARGRVRTDVQSPQL